MIWAGYGLGALLAPSINIGSSVAPKVGTMTTNTSTGTRTVDPIFDPVAAIRTQQAKVMTAPSLQSITLKGAVRLPSMTPSSAPSYTKPADVRMGGSAAAIVAAAREPVTPGGAAMAAASANQRQGSAAAGGSGSTASGNPCGDVVLACQSAGGAWDGSSCAFADGSKIGLDASCQSVCKNAVGQCAGSAAGGKTAMLIGAVALAALFLLK